MWDDFVAKLSMANGAPLFCDSCHQGRFQQLDRHDKKALAQGWTIIRRQARPQGGKSNECETCHVDMECTSAKWSEKCTESATRVTNRMDEQTPAAPWCPKSVNGGDLKRQSLKTAPFSDDRTRVQ